MANYKTSADYSDMAAHSRLVAVQWDEKGYAARAASYRARALQCEKLAKLAKLGTVAN